MGRKRTSVPRNRRCPLWPQPDILIRSITSSAHASSCRHGKAKTSHTNLQGSNRPAPRGAPREIPKRQDCNHKQCEDKSRYFHGFVECNIFDVSDMIVRCHWSLHYQKEAESSFRTLIPKQESDVLTSIKSGHSSLQIRPMGRKQASTQPGHKNKSDI